MIDVLTQQPLRVLTEDPIHPYIALAESQVEEVQALLDRHGIRYSVDEYAISFNGSPEETTIDLARGTDAAAVQAILDSVD